MSFEIFQPTSVPEAIDLLSRSPLPFDSPSQRRYRTLQHLEYAFGAERRRPEWVWAARDAAGAVAATVGAVPKSPGIVLDHFGIADAAALPAVLKAATGYAEQLPEPVASLFTPAGLGGHSPQVQPWTDAFDSVGWQLLVERHHYEFQPDRDLASGVVTGLRLAPLTGPDDPRLVDVHRSILRGTLDAHDSALIQRVGLEAATRESLDQLLDADPWECIHLAFAGDPEPVGLVSWHSMGNGRGFLAFVGVAQSARGRGYGRELVALATRGLLQEGSTTLIADTDSTNTPMARAFADVGWPDTETRIDFIPRS